MTELDKLLERARYEARAQSQMIDNQPVAVIPLGSQTIPAYLRTPYIFFEQMVSELIQPNQRVLDLGAP
jgi:hypothetical protein